MEENYIKKPIYKSKLPYFGLMVNLLFINIPSYYVFYPYPIIYWILVFSIISQFIISWFYCYLKFYDAYVEISFPTRFMFNKKIQICYNQIHKINFFMKHLGNVYIIIKYQPQTQLIITKKFLYTDYFIKQIEKRMLQIEKDKILA